MRKKCPTCFQHWPNHKDPVAEDANTLMSLRIGDLVKGLSVHSLSCDAGSFQEPLQRDPYPKDAGDAVEVALKVTSHLLAGGHMFLAAERIMQIDEAESIIQQCLDKVQDAKRNLAATPLVMSMKEFIEVNATEQVEDGLDTWPAVRVQDYRIIAAGEVLRVQELEEIEDNEVPLHNGQG